MVKDMYVPRDPASDVSFSDLGQNFRLIKCPVKKQVLIALVSSSINFYFHFTFDIMTLS